MPFYPMSFYLLCFYLLIILPFVILPYEFPTFCHFTLCHSTYSHSTFCRSAHLRMIKSKYLYIVQFKSRDCICNNFERYSSYVYVHKKTYVGQYLYIWKSYRSTIGKWKSCFEILGNVFFFIGYHDAHQLIDMIIHFATLTLHNFKNSRKKSPAEFVFFFHLKLK